MGLPIPITDDAPSITTIFCVQSFWRDRLKLAAGRLRQYRYEADALAAAARLSAKDPGVIAFSVTGNVGMDYWQEPVLLVSYGELPEGLTV